jgi:O-antigen ligase
MIRKILIDKYNSSLHLIKILLIMFIILFTFFLSFDSNINQLILKIMFPLWLLSLNFKKIVYFFRNEQLFFIIIIFSLWILITCLITLNFEYSFERYLKYFLIPVIIISTSIKKENINYIIGAFLLGMFINEIISYGIYFEIIRSQIFGFNIVGNKHNPVPFLPSHMEYTLFLSLSIILSIFSFFNVNKKIIKIILSIFILTMVTNLFLTTGRTGQFTLLGALIILSIIYFRHNYKYILLSFITIFIIFIMAFFLSNNTNERIKKAYSDIVNVINNKDYNTSLGVRLSSYILIPKIIENEKFNILYGTGYSNLNEVIHQIHIKEFGDDSIFKVQEGHLHNSYITIFAGTGIIGFILFMLIWYKIFKIEIKDIYINYVRYSFLFILFLGGFTENMFRQKEVMMLAAVFISIIIYVAIINYEEKTNE